MKRHWWSRIIASIAIAAATATVSPAYAGRNCDDVAPDAAKTQKAIRLAKQVRDTLELSGANLALVGRIGSDQSKRGVRYTHVGYVMREHPAGAWTVVHELNACGSGQSELFDEGLANFYMDDLFEFETRIVIPSAGNQEKIARALLGPAKRSLHEPEYSSIAFPWSTKYQNSNGWVLELYAAAMSDTNNGAVSRERSQTWLKGSGYRPSRIHIGGGERAGARLFAANVRFGDHPDTAWQTQYYEVNTGDAALDFVRSQDPESRQITQRLDGKAVVAAARQATPPSPAAHQTTMQPRPVSQVAAAEPAPAAPVASASSRAQLLQSMQGLIVSYACRPQGYLSQCRQMERSPCEKQVGDAVVRCFATVPDQQLINAPEQVAMQQMQEIGYCAVEGVNNGFAATGRPARTAQGALCPSVRDYR